MKVSFDEFDEHFRYFRLEEIPRQEAIEDIPEHGRSSVGGVKSPETVTRTSRISNHSTVIFETSARVGELRMLVPRVSLFSLDKPFFVAGYLELEASNSCRQA